MSEGYVLHLTRDEMRDLYEVLGGHYAMHDRWMQENAGEDLLAERYIEEAMQANRRVSARAHKAELGGEG